MKKILSEGDRIRQLNRFLNEANGEHSEPDGDEDEYGNEPDDHDESEEEVEEGLGTAIKKAYHGNRVKHHARKAIDAQNFLTKGREQRKSGSAMDSDQTYANRKKAGEKLKKHDAAYNNHRGTLKKLRGEAEGRMLQDKTKRDNQKKQDTGPRPLPGTVARNVQSKLDAKKTMKEDSGTNGKAANQGYQGPYADRTSADKKKEDAANKRLRDRLDKKTVKEEIKPTTSYGFTKNGKLMYKGSKAKSMQLMKLERKSDPSAAYQLVYSQHLPKPGNPWPAGGLKKEAMVSTSKKPKSGLNYKQKLNRGVASNKKMVVAKPKKKTSR